MSIIGKIYHLKHVSNLTRQTIYNILTVRFS